MNSTEYKKHRFKKQYLFSIFFVLACFGLPYLVSYCSNALADLPNEVLGKQSVESQKDTFSEVANIFDPNYTSKIANDKGVSLDGNPIHVDCGVYVKSFGSFDYNKNSFFTNFYIWWLMDENVKISPENSMDITNGQQWVRLWAVHDKIRNKTRVQARFYGVINHIWTMKYFPFDRQKIRISIEDNLADINHVRFNALSNESRLSPDVSIVGWKLRFNLIHEPHLYNTSFGDLDNPSSVYSRLNIIFDMKREGWPIFFVYFVGYFVALFLSLLTYLIPKRYFSESTTLCLGAIFAAISNKSQLEFSLSGTEGLSFSGIFTICTFSIIMITIISTILTHSLYVSERRNVSSGINYSVFFSIIILTIIIMGSALQEAVNS